MTAYLPDLHNLLGVAGLAVTLATLLALGSLATARGTLPELQLAAGWGLACLVLTLWTVLTPASAAIPAAVLAAAALLCLAHPRLRARISPLKGAGQLLLLSLPLWLVLLPLRPSQVDTWLNLLPNAAYLYDHNMLPADARPPSYSFLPGAPYNTQFVAYLASLASGSFAESSMALFNLALLCASALLFARVIGGRGTEPSWSACAASLLLSVPLNPGFVPRVSLAPYGETPLAVTTMFAVWAAREVIIGLAGGAAWPSATAALALILAALVNIKQSGAGQLVSIALPLLLVLLAHPRIARKHAAVVFAVTLLPAVLLALAWRAYVEHSFALGELKPLPFAAWNFALLPQVLASILRTIFEKATLFVFVAAALAAAIWQWRHDPWHARGLLFGMAAGVFVLFNLFLLFTYLAHFPAEMAADAHSYFRYMSQLSLLVILVLAVALRPLAAHWLAKDTRCERCAAACAIVLVLAIPPAIIGMLRYDLDEPQPLLWDLGHAVARRIHPGDRLALLVPGDQYDSVGSMLRGVLLFTPPRHADLDIRTETEADAATLRAAATAGYTLALVSCVHGEAELLRRTPDGWQPEQGWPWPPDIARWRFAALLARGPLCGVPPQ